MVSGKTVGRRGILRDKMFLLLFHSFSRNCVGQFTTNSAKGTNIGFPGYTNGDASFITARNDVMLNKLYRLGYLLHLFFIYH